MNTHTTVDTVYGAIMRYYRKQAKLTQWSVCTAFGVTNTVYSRYERGELPIPVTFLFTMMKIYHKTHMEITLHVSLVESLLALNRTVIVVNPLSDARLIAQHLTPITQSTIDMCVKKARHLLSPEQQ